MFLVYIDDSGDEHVRCFSALLIHETVWRDTQKALRDYRRSLKQSDGIYVTKELHATEFVAGRGQIGPSTVSKWRRCEIFRETLKLAANLPKVRMLNAFGSKANERVLFERLLTRINHSVSAWKSHALVIHDEGKDYTYLVRRLGVYNPCRVSMASGPTASDTGICLRAVYSKTSFTMTRDSPLSFS